MTATARFDRLQALAVQLGNDELTVLMVVAERLLQGQQQYGVFRLGSERRAFAVEALEEAADGLVYAACALIRGRV